MTDNPTDPKHSASLFRLDLRNVLRRCIACNGSVVTSYDRTPVCVKCRAKGLAGADEVRVLQEQLANYTAWFDEVGACACRFVDGQAEPVEQCAFHREIQKQRDGMLENR